MQVQMIIPSGNLILPAGAIANADISDNAAITRAKLAQEPLGKYPIDFNQFRVWDNLSLLVPATSATDDLGLIIGTFGTNAPKLQTRDVKALGAVTSLYARCLWQLPPEYDSGQTLQIRVRAGMNTTIADVSATVDIECYKLDGDGAVGSDLCSTAAQSINSLSKANFDFTITESGLVPGDQLDVRVTLAIRDNATGTAVKGEISRFEFFADIKG